MANAQGEQSSKQAPLTAEQVPLVSTVLVVYSSEENAQAAALATYESKRAKMLEEYNHLIKFRADPLPITKISYRINNSTKEASIKANDVLLKNLKAKFQWVKTQAEKLGVSPLPQLTAFRFSNSEKKRKRTSEIIKAVFVKENIIVDGMHRNMTPPPWVVPSEGLVIKEPKAGIFFYNGNFDLVFQREEEFHLATTPQLIKIQNSTKLNIEIAEDMYQKMILAIEARDDVVEARKIFILVYVLLYATYHSTGSSDTDQIVSLVGPAGDPWDQRVHSQLNGKDLASGLLVYELPLSITMTKVIKGDFKKLESLKISDVSLTCNTSLEIFNEEFNRMSRMDDDLFTYEVEIAEIYWARGDDEVELTDKESFDSEDEDKVAKFFRIETNVFDFETPLCRAFKEFNYLLQIDPDLLIKEIKGFKTYEDYKDD
ncbi:hypothetical protein Tco_0116050 [Tanacetum coccineum]